MKILHIISDSFFRARRRTAQDMMVALADAGADNVALSDAALPILTAGFGFKDGIMSRFKIWRIVHGERPDAVIRWGAEARALKLSGIPLDLSFGTLGDDFKSFDPAAVVLCDSGQALAAARAAGFSGAKAFLIPPFCYDYGALASRRELFVPERATVIYVAGAFTRDAGFEEIMLSLASVRDAYFVIQGTGDEPYVAGVAQNAGIKSRCRFVPDIEKTACLLDMCDFAVLPQSPDFLSWAVAAMKGRRLILTAKTPLSAELLDRGSAMFVELRDPYLMKKKLSEIIESGPEFRAPLVEAAAAEAEALTPSRAANALLARLKELAGKQ